MDTNSVGNSPTMKEPSANKAHGSGAKQQPSRSPASPSPSVTIKREKLENAGHFIISPDKKTSSIASDPTKETLPSLADSIKAFKGVTQNKLRLDDDEIRRYLKTWATHNPIDVKIQEIDSMDHDTIYDIVSDIVTLITDEEINEKDMQKEVDKEVQAIYEVVKGMEIHSTTTNEQLLRFSARQRAYFVYWAFMHEEQDMSLDDVLAQPTLATLTKLQEWRDKQKVTDLDATMKTPSSEHRNESRTNTTQISQEKHSFSPQPMEVDLQNTVRIDRKQIPIIDSQLTDAVIKNMDINTLRTVYSKHMADSGTPIANEILKLWKPTLLRSNIIMHRNNIQKSESKQSVTENPKINSVKGNLKKAPKYSNNPVQAKLDMTTFQSFRYDMSFILPTELKGTDGLRSHFADIFQTFQGYCDGLKLMPWDDTSKQMETLENVDDLPSSITQLKKYLFNVRAPIPGSRSYFSLRLSFPIRSNRSTFDADVIAWSQANNIRFNECSVQHADVRSVGWLAYAPNSLNAKKWCKAVQELFQAYYKKKNVEPLMLGLTWRPMNGQYNIESKKKVFAMHVNTPRHKGALTKKFLRVLAHNKKWPLGVRFRLVDEYHEYMSEPTKIKYRYMLDRHRTFVKEMKQISNDQVINADKRIGDSKMTVRDLVNNIRDSSDNKRIFASFDPKWNDPSIHIAVFRPDKSSKAGGFIKNLSAYVRHLYPNASLNRIFTIESISLAEETEFDPKTQTFLTQEQKDFDAEIQADLDDDSFDFLIPDSDPDYIAVDMDNIKLLGGEKLYNLTGDDDTASTHPTSSSMISFSSNSIHHYDTESCADGSDPNQSKLSSQDILQRISSHHQKTLNQITNQEKLQKTNNNNASISNAIADQQALLNQSSIQTSTTTSFHPAAPVKSQRTNKQDVAAET